MKNEDNNHFFVGNQLLSLTSVGAVNLKLRICARFFLILYACAVKIHVFVTRGIKKHDLLHARLWMLNFYYKSYAGCLSLSYFKEITEYPFVCVLRAENCP